MINHIKMVVSLKAFVFNKNYIIYPRVYYQSLREVFIFDIYHTNILPARQDKYTSSLDMVQKLIESFQTSAISALVR